MSKQRITPGGVVIAENVPVPLSALDRAADGVRLATADERDAMLAVDRELLVRQIWGLQSRLLGLEAELAEAGGGTVRCVVDGCHNLVLGYRLNWLGLATCSPTCERQLRRARAETRAAAMEDASP